jgi:hypothetical protein
VKYLARFGLLTALVVLVIGSAPVWGPLLLLYFGIWGGIWVFGWLVDRAFPDDPRRCSDRSATDFPQKAHCRLPEGWQPPRL